MSSGADPPPPPPPSPPPLPAGWIEIPHTNGRVYYANSSLGTSQWARPTSVTAAAAAPPLYIDRRRLLGGLTYKYGSQNGIDPAQFRSRLCADRILAKVPDTVEDWKLNSAKTRVQLYGPPASGKTSIVGKLDQALRLRYSNIPVYYINGSADYGNKENIVSVLSTDTTFLVLLDDAQEWYDFLDFWRLFKSPQRMLIFAASYSVEQFNPATPVDVQLKEKTNLEPEEVTRLLRSLNVDWRQDEELRAWFGDNYGYYSMLVPKLLEEWKQNSSTSSLAQVFYKAETFEMLKATRMLPELNEVVKEMLLRVWKGQATPEDKGRMVRYGLFCQNGEWSCEFVRRRYFSLLFHTHSKSPEAFSDTNSVPGEFDILKLGFQELKWRQIKQSGQSSVSGFPIEDVWQAVFYASIGQLIPQHLTFCKEYVAHTDNRVDFVLRNGETRAIEFLIKSSDVPGHHKRFEEGAYSSLKLTGSYLVVDIKPWNKQLALYDAADNERLDVANNCFTALVSLRRARHAVFLVSDDLSSGILYGYDLQTNTAVELMRSPQDARQI